MPRVFLIEDEAPALRRLTALLAEVDPTGSVAGTADSVAAADRWLRSQPAPDLILADIQLGDGLSLDLFRATPPSAPVVFTTAHDTYLLEAFAAHGIAYLLKPVKPADLAAALRKHAELARHYGTSLAALARALDAPAHPAGRWRQRLLAQRGSSRLPIAVAEIAYFLSADKLTFLVTHAGGKALVDEPLATLEAELDPGRFFRLNRNVLAQIDAVRRFTPVGKGRLLVELAPPAAGEVQVSQERAAAFRAWAGS